MAILRDPLARKGFPLWARIYVAILKFGKSPGGVIPVAFTPTEDGRMYAIMADSKLYALQVSSGLATNAPWPMFKHDVRHSGSAK